MIAGSISAKRKCGFILSATCLCVFVLYTLYWADIPHLSDDSFISDFYDLQSFKPSEAKDDIDFKATPTTLPIVSATTQVDDTTWAAPTLPPEYSTFSEDRQRCELFFTPSYLEHIATHQQPYCEEQSESAFQCFAAPRLEVPVTAAWGQTDPLCVAQGVSFNPELAGSSNEFNIQCKLRDLASERASSADAARAFEGFRDRPTDWGWYWGDTGVGASLRTWHFEEEGNVDVKGCTRESNKTQWVMLMRRDSTDTHNLWHKLMEILQARHSLDALRIAINPTTGRPWLSETDAADVQLVFDDDREELLEPLWEIVTGRKPIRKSSLQASCFGNVILPLPGCGSPFWSQLLDTGYHEHCSSQTLLTTYINRIFGFYGIVPQPITEIHEHPTITIVERKGNRKFIALDRWIAALKQRYPHSPINVVDFASVTIEEQLRLAQSTDILVGHHGAAMAHIMFMNPEATAVEILPRYFDQHGFRAIAAMRGINYIPGRCMYKEEYEHAVHGTPFPQDWPPPPPQEFNHWQTQEWTYITDEDFLGLIDAAVRTQRNRFSSSDIYTGYFPY